LGIGKRGSLNRLPYRSRREDILLLKNSHCSKTRDLQSEDIEDKIDRASDLILKASSSMVTLATLLHESEKNGYFNTVEKEKLLVEMIDEASKNIDALDVIIQTYRLLS
jgi:hypothetical protein